jgi:hypothetical protein
MLRISLFGPPNRRKQPERYAAQITNAGHGRHLHIKSVFRTFVVISKKALPV